MSGQSHVLRVFVCNKCAHAWMSAAHQLSLVVFVLYVIVLDDALSVLPFFFKHACSVCLIFGGSVACTVHDVTAVRALHARLPFSPCSIVVGGVCVEFVQVSLK